MLHLVDCYNDLVWQWGTGDDRHNLLRGPSCFKDKKTFNFSNTGHLGWR